MSSSINITSFDLLFHIFCFIRLSRSFLFNMYRRGVMRIRLVFGYFQIRDRFHKMIYLLLRLICRCFQISSDEHFIVQTLLHPRLFTAQQPDGFHVPPVALFSRLFKRRAADRFRPPQFRLYHASPRWLTQIAASERL